MNRFDAVPLKVRCVERQDPVDAMYIHRRYESGVMNFSSEDAMVDNESLPFNVDSRGSRAGGSGTARWFPLPEAFAQWTGPCPCSPAGVRLRASCDVPELSDVLHREVHRFTRLEEPGDALNRHEVAGMIGLRAPEQEVGIG